MATVQHEAIFLQAMQWEFADESTGELRRGTTIHLANKLNGTERQKLKGYQLEKMGGSYQLFDQLPPGLEGKPVVIDCEMSIAGKNHKLIPMSVKLKDQK